MDKMGIEKAYREICDDSINMTVPWYLMASYAYYVQDDPILEDHVYDTLAKRILAEWDNIDHHHKNLLNKDMLEAGTFMGDYPPQIKGAVGSVREAYR